MGLPYTAKSVTRPPDHDAPFWVGCGTVLEPVRANAAKSFEPTRVYHIAWGSGGFLAARRARSTRRCLWSHLSQTDRPMTPRPLRPRFAKASTKPATLKARM